MENTGVLRAIRDELAMGRTSRELIELGYAPGSVYRALRQLRRRREHEAAVAKDGGHAVVTLLEERDRARAELEQLRAATDRLQQEAGHLEQDRDAQKRARHAAEAKLAGEQAARTRGEQEIKALRPLQVWAGHPCALCKQPLAGISERPVARALLRHAAHPLCLDQHQRTPLLIDSFGPTFVPVA